MQRGAPKRGRAGKSAPDPNESAKDRQARVNAAIVNGRAAVGLNDELMVRKDVMGVVMLFGTLNMVLNRDGGLKMSAVPDATCELVLNEREYSISHAKSIHDRWTAVKKKVSTVKDEMKSIHSRCETIASCDPKAATEKGKKVIAAAIDAKDKVLDVSANETQLKKIQDAANGVGKVNLDEAEAALRCVIDVPLNVDKSLWDILTMSSKNFRSFRRSELGETVSEEESAGKEDTAAVPTGEAGAKAEAKGIPKAPEYRDSEAGAPEPTERASAHSAKSPRTNSESFDKMLRNGASLYEDPAKPGSFIKEVYDGLKNSKERRAATAMLRKEKEGAAK